jgi:hypothetical protein
MLHVITVCSFDKKTGSVARGALKERKRKANDLSLVFIMR